MFNIDFTKLLTWLLPEFLRRPVRMAWLQILISPVKVMYADFLAKRAADLYFLGHDSRVFSLTAAINDLFDNALRRIYITDGFTKQRLYIYLNAENKPLYLNPTQILYTSGEYSDTGVDFIVWVPAVLNLSAQGKIKLTALVNRYKLAGKRFQIYTA